MQASGLIVGGRVVDVVADDGSKIECFNWHDHGMEFKPGDGARRRVVAKTPLRKKVWHWTGGEGTARALFRVLDGRELGIETAIDADGVLWQFADPIFVDTYDAGPWNPESWGTEITNYGFTAPGRSTPNPKRGTYRTTMNGRPREFARFFPSQIRTALALARAVSKAVPTIALAVPVGADGKLFPSVAPRDFLRRFSGHLGHYHLTDNKADPGHDLLGAFRAAGFEGAKVG